MSTDDLMARVTAANRDVQHPSLATDAGEPPERYRRHQLLGFTDDEHVSICWQEPGGPFRSRIAPARNMTAALNTLPVRACKWYGVNPVALPAGSSQRGGVDDVTRLNDIVFEIDRRPKKGRDGKPIGRELTVTDYLNVLGEVQRFGLMPNLVIDSGHGWHLHWLIDGGEIDDEWTTREVVTGLLKRFREAMLIIASGLDIPVQDNVSDLARVMRVPESMNHKDTPVPVSLWIVNDFTRYTMTSVAHFIDRVHRENPPPPTDYEVDLRHPGTKPPMSQSFTLAGPGQNPAYVRAAIDAELTRLQNAPEGERNNTLNTVAFSVFAYCKGGHAPEGELREIMRNIAVDGLGLPAGEVERTLDSAWGKAEPKHPPKPTTIDGFTVPGDWIGAK